MKLDLYANRSGANDEILIRIHRTKYLHSINYIPVLHTKNSQYYLIFSSEFSRNTYSDATTDTHDLQTINNLPTHPGRVHSIKCYNYSEAINTTEEWVKQSASTNTTYPQIIFTVRSVELIRLPLLMDRLIKIPIPSNVKNVIGFNIIMTDTARILVSIVI